MRVGAFVCSRYIKWKTDMLGLPHSVPCLHTAPLLWPGVSGYCITPATDTVGQYTTSCNATSEHGYISPAAAHASKPSLKLFFLLSIDLISAICHPLALWCEDSPESRAFFDAVFTLKKLRGKCQAHVYPMGSEEEVR